MGFDTIAMLGAALLDHEWHRLPRTPPRCAPRTSRPSRRRRSRGTASTPTWCRRATARRTSRTSFTNGYDAGYYSYLWSEVLDADMVDWFEENGGLTRENGDVFRQRLLSRGGSVDPMAAFASIRGRGPSTEPLLKRRGLLS